MKNYLGIASAVLLGAATQAAATNLIQNGDFSQFSPGTVGSTFRSNGSASLTDWTQNVPASGNNGGLIVVLAGASLNGADIINDGGASYSLWNASNGGFGTIATPPSGNTYVFAQDSAPENASYLSQTITGLVVGQKYAVTFSWAGAQLRNDSGSLWNGVTNEEWEVNLGGTYNGGTTQSFSGGQTEYTSEITDVPEHGSTTWQSAMLHFVASSTSEVLNLEAVSSSSGDPPFALIDNIQMNAVPEPAAWTMMIVGLSGLGALARRRRAKMAFSAA
jgi:hypothetical protein